MSMLFACAQVNQYLAIQLILQLVENEHLIISYGT